MKNIEQWKKKRCQTVISFRIVTYTIGFEYGLAMTTIFSYLKNILKVLDPGAWLGWITAAYFFGSLVGNLTLSKIADRTRRTKMLILGASLFAFVGGVLYMMPYSPYNLLIGRFLQGFADGLISVINGEIARVYPDAEVPKALTTFTGYFWIGVFLGPLVSVILTNVNFHLFGISIVIENLPGLVIACCWILCFTTVMLFVNDLSREFDLKAHMEKFGSLEEPDQGRMEVKENLEQTCSEDESLHKNKSFKTDEAFLIATLLKTHEFIFIIIVSPFCGSCSSYFGSLQLPAFYNLLIPSSDRYLGLAFSTITISMTIILFILARIKTYKREIYFIAMGTSLLSMLFQMVLFGHLIAGHNSFTEGYILIFTLAFLTGIANTMEQVFFLTLLTRLVPSSIQSFAEGLRRTAGSIMLILAGLTFEFIQVHLVESMILLSVVTVIISWYTMIFRDKYIDMKHL